MSQPRSVKKKPADLVVRAMEPADAEACAKLWMQESVYMGTLRTAYESVSASTKGMLVENPLRKSLVATISGVIAGQVSVSLRSRERLRHAADVGIMVHERFRGRGVGGALLDAAIDYAENWSNVLRIELEVFVDNTAAIALYRSRGFNMEGIARAFALRNGVYVDAFRMARVAPLLPHARLTAEDVAARPLPQLSKGASDPAPPKKKNGRWGSGRGSA